MDSYFRDSEDHIVPRTCIRCGGYNCDKVSCSACSWDKRNSVSGKDECSNDQMLSCMCSKPIWKTPSMFSRLQVDLDDAMLKLAMIQRLIDADTMLAVSKLKIRHILKGGWKNGHTRFSNS